MQHFLLIGALTLAISVSSQTGAQQFGGTEYYKDWAVQNDGNTACRTVTSELGANRNNNLFIYHDSSVQDRIAKVLYWPIDEWQGHIYSGTLYVDDTPFKMASEDNTFLSLQIDKNPEIIPLMKAGSNAKLVFRASDGNDYSLKFSLSGFTASALKMSELCNFDVFEYAQQANINNKRKTSISNKTQSAGSVRSQDGDENPQQELMKVLVDSYSVYRLIEHVCMGYYPQDTAASFIGETVDNAISYFSVDQSKIDTLKDDAWNRSEQHWKREFSSVIQQVDMVRMVGGKSQGQALCVKIVDQYEPIWRKITEKYTSSGPAKSKRKF